MFGRFAIDAYYGDASGDKIDLFGKGRNLYSSGMQNMWNLNSKHA